MRDTFFERPIWLICKMHVHDNRSVAFTGVINHSRKWHCIFCLSYACRFQPQCCSVLVFPRIFVLLASFFSPLSLNILSVESRSVDGANQNQMRIMAICAPPPNRCCLSDWRCCCHCNRRWRCSYRCYGLSLLFFMSIVRIWGRIIVAAADTEAVDAQSCFSPLIRFWNTSIGGEHRLLLFLFGWWWRWSASGDNFVAVCRCICLSERRSSKVAISSDDGRWTSKLVTEAE